MWTASSISWRSFSVIPVSDFPRTPAVPSIQQRRLSAQPQNDAASSAGDTTLFKSILDQEEVGDGRQLSGSDVLWALQRAAAAAPPRKKKMTGSKKKKKRGSSPVCGNRDSSPEDSLDYSNVKPLCMKDDWGSRLDDWGSRLDDLERRLQELSDI